MATTQAVEEVLSRFEDDELEEWLVSLDDVRYRYGDDAVAQLLEVLERHAAERGMALPANRNTPYINTIPVDAQAEFPGDEAVERRLRSLVRWNAMAMVVRANRHHHGIGGHISTYASAATLFEVGFNHFFHAPTDQHPGDFVYLQGHASPGVYARAFLEGRFDERQLENFRREAPRETGLSSYPHAWLMPDFWQYPTVSMGLSPIQAIYQARFLRYLAHRGLLDTSQSRVWCLAGDGEMDEPESVGALSLAARERLDNLVLVVNCNLQRLDGPVRGNGKLIQELEALFRGAGWNCIKVIWGSKWDPLLAKDQEGELVRRMGEVVDGQYQKYAVESGDFIRRDFFGASPQLEQLVADLSDDELKKLNRGGHDAVKVHAAYRAAVDHRGAPTVILAKTIKGYGLGEAGAGRNITHKQKELNEQELLAFRDRFDIPLSDEQVGEAPFFKPDDDSPEIHYLQERRRALGGYLPARRDESRPLEIPDLDAFAPLLEAHESSTTMAFDRVLAGLLGDEQLGPRIVPIIPDEARTFGLETLFARCGIYSSVGQRYVPVDADQLIRYKEARDGQILEEGITEAGAMSSFIAAGTSYASLRLPMIPFYLFYSMFGFQRIGDLAWAAGDARTKGFLLGCTAGRTTLNGEGLQHQDGHSPLVASTIPNLRSYDPAYSYEVAVLVREGLRRMYHEQRAEFYYLTLYNEPYSMPDMPDGASDDILRGMHRVRRVDGDSGHEKKGDKKDGKGAKDHRPQLLASGSLLPHAREAQDLLAEQFGVSSDLWSVTSYCQLRRDALAAERWNRLHPEEKPRRSFLEQRLEGVKAPCVAVSDYMKAVPDQIARWAPAGWISLGTDGFGRSDTRPKLREHFEVDARHIAFAALTALARQSQFKAKRLGDALRQLELDPEKAAPAKT